MSEKQQTALDRFKGAQVAKKGNTLADHLQQVRGELAKALPKHMDVDRLIRLALTSVRQNPRLAECTMPSILGAIMQAAQLGLEPDGILGQAYLVPYKNKGTLEAQFQIGYRGYLALTMRSGQVRSVAAEVVYEGDSFSFAYGSKKFIRHTPTLAERGKPIAAYAIAHFKDGGDDFRVLQLADIERARSCSRGADRDDSPWRTHWQEMARKTAVRALAKYLPLSVEVQRAAVEEEYREAGMIDATATMLPAVPTAALEAHEEKSTRQPKESKAGRLVDTGEPPFEGEPPYEREPGGEG